MKPFIESLEKAPIIIAGICYVLGLLVVSMYLNQFGVSAPVSLFRVSYLLAGVWVFLCLVFPLLLLIMIQLTLMTVASIPILHELNFPVLLTLNVHDEDPIDDNPKYFRLPLIFTLLALPGIAMLPLLLGVDILHWEWLYLGYWNIMYWLFISVCLNLALGFKIQGKKINSSLCMGLIIISTFGYLTHYVYDFSKMVYRYIPSYVGGGKPSEVQFAVKSDKSLKQLKALGITVNKDTLISDRCQLLFTTEDEFIIVKNDGDRYNAVSINRDLMNGVHYFNVEK